MPRPPHGPAGGAGRGGLPRPRKRFGQHFLRDRGVLARIAGALELAGGEAVVEIGPGRGALTDLLAERLDPGRGGRLVAVEIDRDLAQHLRERYAGRPHVRILEQDVLTAPLADAAGTEDFVLAGNVPYYITTPILFHALRPPRPRRAVYLVQREVADRLAAAPGGKTYGALSVNVQAVATAELVARVPPGAFLPPPKVDSAVVRLTPRADPVVAPEEERAFRRFVVQAFGLRRKQMARVLRSAAALDADAAAAVCAAAGVDAEARPETLAPEAFAAVVRALGAHRLARGAPAAEPDDAAAGDALPDPDDTA